MDASTLLREFKIKHFITGNEDTPVNQELTKWFLFLISGNGKSIKNLSAADFKAFKAGVSELMELVYLWQQDQSIK